MTSPEVYASRAERAYWAMRRRFARSDGLYRRPGRLHWPGAPDHLWPVARAFVATLDLAGAGGELTPGLDLDREVIQHVAALEHYWDPSGPYPAYASDPPGVPWGGDLYYDDNAWVGLGLVQLERMRAGAGHLPRARQLFDFAVGGWDDRPDVPSPGGVFWVQQGRGAGRRNHDRNTVSNAPNAELGLHLRELTTRESRDDGTYAQSERMYQWVRASLGCCPRGDPAGLYWDKIRADGSIDRALWSYNQGSMIGAGVLLERLAPDSGEFLAQAEATARVALGHYQGHYFDQSPAFNAIFFRNLLLLHDATADTALQDSIRHALRGYADQAWNEQRDDADLFCPRRGAVSLLDQSALVSVQALVAWDERSYSRLA
ncbi:MAG: glycoside hydrolase family 76 protein [Actinomycetota bacterium]|nr:glycoside hydrolase family 76 protein [Actinomycetota bacterium]